MDISSIFNLVKLNHIYLKSSFTPQSKVHQSALFWQFWQVCPRCPQKDELHIPPASELGCLQGEILSLKFSSSFHVTSSSDVLLCLSLESGYSDPWDCGLCQDSHLPRQCLHLCSKSAGGNCGVWHIRSFRNWGGFFKLCLCIFISTESNIRKILAGGLGM